MLRERKGEWKVCFDLVGLDFWDGSLIQEYDVRVRGISQSI